MSIDTITGIDIVYNIAQELPLSADGEAAPDTKYISDGPHVLDLPPIDTTPGGSAVFIKQVTGNGTVRDAVSVHDLTDKPGDTVLTMTITEGRTTGFILASAFGRTKWMQLPSFLFAEDNAAAAGGGGTGNTLEVTNGRAAVVPTGAYVTLKQDGTYGLITALNDGEFGVGVHIGDPANLGDPLTIVTTGPVEALCSTSLVWEPGTAMTATVAGGGQGTFERRWAHSPTEANKKICGFFRHFTSGGKAIIHLVEPFIPSRFTKEIYLPNISGVTGSYQLAANRQGGKYIYHGKPAFCLAMWAKSAVVPTTLPYFDVNKNSNWFFNMWCIGGAVADTYGNPQLGVDYDDSCLFQEGDELDIWLDDGSLDGSGYTLKILFEELVTYAMIDSIG